MLHLIQRRMARVVSALLFMAGTSLARAQNTSTDVPPIIDVHHHAMDRFRGSAGNPLLLEELLARHPKLRVQIMHAGYPMIDNLLTLLQANSHVYVDVAGLIWSYPIKEVNRYMERIVDAGFEDRIMFGTDQFVWPKLMAYSISIIQDADYLTPEQKRDILYNNAVRFLRLDTSNK